MSIIHLAAPPFPYFIECGYERYRPGDQHPNRRHIGLFDLLFVQTGCLHIGEDGTEWELGPGQSLILLPDRHHYAVKPCAEETRFYWVHFLTVCEWQQAEEDSPVPEPDAHLRRYRVYPYTIELPKHSLMPEPASAYDLLLRLIELTAAGRSSAAWERQRVFESLMALLDRKQQVHARSRAALLAERTEAYIRGRYAEPITAASLTEALHFHYNYIARCMKQVYGMSPLDYVLHCRLEQAKTLLLKTDRPIGDIAGEVGFENAPYFTRRFSEKNGLSPLRYRKLYTD